MRLPPLTCTTCPLTHSDSSQAKYTHRLATSSTLPMRRSGTVSIWRRRRPGVVMPVASSRSVRISPGATALTRMFLCPHSTAMVAVMFSSPALAAP